MGLLKRIFLLLLLFNPKYCCAKDMLEGHHQLLVVTTNDWEEKKGVLHLFERNGDSIDWNPIKEAIPVVIGRNGLAWGIGLHPQGKMPSKVEGDGKSPAGIFSLGTAFGFATHLEMVHLEIEYLQLEESTEAVDDPSSNYYNFIVNNKEVTPDWCSSEKMKTESLYKLGFVINHNFPNPLIGAGSAIFFHIWNEEASGTEGCTSVSEENLITILSWLDRSKNPTIVQLPISTYHELKNEWNLPELKLE